MKKTILFFISLFVTISGMAGNVSETKAAQIAESVFCTTRSGDVSLVWTGSGSTRGSNPSFYVFNYDGGGFVVISAEDRTKPILAYSNEGSFKVEGMPSHIRTYFDGYSKQIEAIRNSSLTQSVEVAALWNSLKAPQIVKNLNTATWGQDAPFNNNCPKVDSQQSVTGCVATAIATVMYYHKWPKSQSGTLPSYSYETDKGNTRTQAGHNLAEAYDWDSMQSSYKSSSTSKAKTAVATLMFDIGVMLQSSYNGADGTNTFGTAAYTDDIAPMLIKYMDYDSSAVLRLREEMSSSNWHSALKNEIDEERPVLYGGNGESGGHQFIIDGYGSDDYFHVNWGWDGDDNGLYLLEVLGEDDWIFDTYQGAIFNLKPNAKGKPAERVQYCIGENNAGGMIWISGTFAKGNTVKVASINIMNGNSGYIDDSGVGSLFLKFKMCLVDKNENVKETYFESDGYEELPGGYYFEGDTISCKITKDLEFGDKIMMFYKTTGDWAPIRICYDYYNFEYSSKILNISDAVSVYDFPEIEVNPDGYRAGDVLDLRIINCQYVPSITWYFDGNEVTNGKNYVQLTSGKHTIKAVVACYKGSVYSGSKQRTETLTRVINVN